MTRPLLRRLIWSLFPLAILFASWGWLRPYEWHADEKSRAHIAGAELRKDESFYWVTVHLKILPEIEHDLQKPTRLVIDGSEEVEPADTTLIGSPEKNVTELWFKFWLDQRQISRPLTLKMNDGELSVKSTVGIPDISDTPRYFSTHRW